MTDFVFSSLTFPLFSSFFLSLLASLFYYSDQKGVSGNMADGSDAVIVARNDPNVREKDGLVWLRYSSARKQGGGGLTTSFLKKKAVRVFRSSAVTNSLFAPPNNNNRGKRSGNHVAATYRYDGLYVIDLEIERD